MRKGRIGGMREGSIKKIKRKGIGGGRRGWYEEIMKIKRMELRNGVWEDGRKEGKEELRGEPRII